MSSPLDLADTHADNTICQFTTIASVGETCYCDDIKIEHRLKDGAAASLLKISQGNYTVSHALVRKLQCYHA